MMPQRKLVQTPGRRSEILGIARAVRRRVVGTGVYCDPQGRCHEAAVEISKRLARAGISHEVIGGWFQSATRPRGHVWVRFPQHGGAILDVTADQFDPQAPGVWFPANPSRYEARDVIPVRGGHPRRITPIMYGRIYPRPVRVRVRVRSSLRRRAVEHLKNPPDYCLCHKSKAVDGVRRGLIRRLDR